MKRANLIGGGRLPDRAGDGAKSVVNRGVAGVARICRGRGASPGPGQAGVAKGAGGRKIGLGSRS